MKKKCSALLLALVMCLGLLPAVAFAADEPTPNHNGVAYAVTGGNIYFDKSTGTVVGADETVTSANIPSSIEGVPVSAIGYYAFYWSEDLTSVTIPQSVTQIGEDAFAWTKLTSVTIPDSVTSIGGWAFYSCFKLTSVVLSKNLTSIGEGAFYDCRQLTSVVIPEGVASIGDRAFERCKKLTSIIIPNSVKEIGSRAFADCESLTEITLPDRVSSLGNSVFYNCKSLTEITIPKGISDIGYAMFDYCASLTSVVIPDGVTTIDKIAFQGCTKLAVIDIPASVVSVGNSAFYACDSLKDVNYGGTPTQWAEVKFSERNDSLKAASIHFGKADAAAQFSDLKPGAFYLEPVAWAVDKKVTTGKTATTFAPNENCTHGQILTFLWRAAGEPESSATTPFAMNGGEYYYGAAKWAYEKGMIGADFEHGTSCTRADAVNYIWQAAGKSTVSYDGRFTDVPASSPYATAVAWAVANGVTTGTGATTFTPGKICNRGEIVTFLYRYFGK